MNNKHRKPKNTFNFVTQEEMEDKTKGVKEELKTIRHLSQEKNQVQSQLWLLK